jgi:hypothetical protein
MKKLSLLFVFCSVLFFFVSSSYADYFRDGPVSNGFLMTAPVPAHKIQLSAQVEYVDYSEVYAGNTAGMAEPLRDVADRAMLTVIPLKAAYGVTDNLSIRLTVPLIDFHFESKNPPAKNGYGIGDLRLEGLYSVLKETDSNPSAAVDLCVKPASATDWIHRGLNEYPIGSGATDWMITGIFGKKIGPIGGTAVLGFNFRGATQFGKNYIVPGTEFICSVAGVYPAGDYDLGAELWGSFSPDSKIIYAAQTADAMLENSELIVIDISPFVRYKASPDLTLKAAVDIPVGTKMPVDDVSDNSLRVFRGVNVTLGGSWTI